MKILYKDKVVAYSSKDEKGNPVIKAVEGVHNNFLPFEIFGFTGRQGTITQFFNWANSRCFPEDRIGADELLAELGLDRYDAWEIVKKTKGVMPGIDYFSIEL